MLLLGVPKWVVLHTLGHWDSEAKITKTVLTATVMHTSVILCYSERSALTDFPFIVIATHV